MGLRTVLAALLGVLLLHILLLDSAALAQDRPGRGAVQSVPVAARVPAEPTPAVFDHDPLYLGCLATGSAAVLMLAHPGPGDWAIPGGWHVGVPAVALRLLLGCYYGLLAGMAVSAVGYLWP